MSDLDFENLKRKIVDENFTSFQLVRAVDGTRTDVVILPFQEVLDVLSKVEKKEDFVLVLHQADFEKFSLYPLMTIDSFLKLNSRD